MTTYSSHESLITGCVQTHAQNTDTHSRPQTSHSATAAYPCNAVVIVQAGIAKQFGDF